MSGWLGGWGCVMDEWMFQQFEWKSSCLKLFSKYTQKKRQLLFPCWDTNPFGCFQILGGWVGGRVSVGGWVEVDDWKTQFQVECRSQTCTLTDGCGIGKQSNRETRVVINYLQIWSSNARVSSSENEKIAISQQLSHKMKK